MTPNLHKKMPKQRPFKAKCWVNILWKLLIKPFFSLYSVKYTSRGFSLLEASFVLLLIGIMGGAVTKMLTVYTQADRMRIMRQKMERIVESMGIYYETFKRLPPPLKSRPLTPSISSGEVPYQDLGLSKMAVKDAWGKPMRYIVRNDIMGKQSYFSTWPPLSKDADKIYICQGSNILSPFPEGVSVDEVSTTKPPSQEILSVALMHCNWVAFVLYWGDEPTLLSQLPGVEPPLKEGDEKNETYFIPAVTNLKCILDFSAQTSQKTTSTNYPAWARMPRWESYNNFVAIYARGTRPSLAKLVANWSKKKIDSEKKQKEDNDQKGQDAKNFQGKGTTQNGKSTLEKISTPRNLEDESDWYLEDENDW